MTTSFGPFPKDTLAGLRMPKNSNEVIGPEKFAEICRDIVKQHEGHEAHRLMDSLTTQLLVSLGYGEGAMLFAKAVYDWHHSQLQYPLPRKRRWKCKLGWHEFRADRESLAPWASPEICVHCNARQCASLHEICP